MEIRYSGKIGSLVASAESVSQDNNHVFKLLLWDTARTQSATGAYPFFIKGTSKTMVHIKNTSKRKQGFYAYLTFGERKTYLVNHGDLEANETFEIDIKKLRDEKLPDLFGRILPEDMSEGQITWSLIPERAFSGAERRSFEEDARKPKGQKKRRAVTNKSLVGQMTQIDTGKGVNSTYFCAVCCPGSSLGMFIYSKTQFEANIDEILDELPGVPDGLPGPTAETTVGGQHEFGVVEARTTCYSSAPIAYFPSPGYVSWSTDNSNIATIDGNGVATGKGEGTTKVNASLATGEYTYVPCSGGGEPGWGFEGGFDDGILGWLPDLLQDNFLASYVKAADCEDGIPVRGPNPGRVPEATFGGNKTAILTSTAAALPACNSCWVLPHYVVDNENLKVTSSQTPEIQSVVFEQAPGGGPINLHPTINGLNSTNRGQRIYTGRQTLATGTPESATDGANRAKVRVKAKLANSQQGVTIHFATFDMDDPSANTAPLDSNGYSGNDNKGSVSGKKEGTLSLPGTSSTNTTASAPTNNMGEAIVELTVTKQPGDNFAVVASKDDTQLSGITASGLDLKAGTTTITSTQTTPTKPLIRTNLLTVWRRLHLEVDTMGTVANNKATGTFNGNQTIAVTGETTLNLNVNPALRENRFEDGRLEFTITIPNPRPGGIPITVPHALTVVNSTLDPITFDPKNSEHC